MKNYFKVWITSDCWCDEQSNAMGKAFERRQTWRPFNWYWKMEKWTWACSKARIRSFLTSVKPYLNSVTWQVSFYHTCHEIEYIYGPTGGPYLLLVNGLANENPEKAMLIKKFVCYKTSKIIVTMLWLKKLFRNQSMPNA